MGCCGSTVTCGQPQFLAKLAVALPQELVARGCLGPLEAALAQPPVVVRARLQQSLALQLTQGRARQRTAQGHQHAPRRRVARDTVLRGVAMDVLQHLLRGEALPVAALAPGPPQQAPFRRQGDRQGHNRHGRHDDQRAGGQALLQAAENGAARPGKAAEDAGQHQHLVQLPGPLPRRHRRGDQQPDHQHHARQLQSQHDRNHDQGGERHVQQAQGEAVGLGEGRVKGDELEFLPQRDQDEEGRQPHGADEHHVLAANGSGLTEDELVQPRLAGIVARLNVGQQGDAEGEKGRQHDAHRRVLFEPRAAHQAVDQQDAQPAGDARAQQQPAQVPSRQQKGQRHPRQRGVRQRVAQQALLAQHGEAAQHAADDTQHGAAGRHRHQGVVHADVAESETQRDDRQRQRQQGRNRLPVPSAGVAQEFASSVRRAMPATRPPKVRRRLSSL